MVVVVEYDKNREQRMAVTREAETEHAFKKSLFQSSDPVDIERSESV